MSSGSRYGAGDWQQRSVKAGQQSKHQLTAADSVESRDPRLGERRSAQPSVTAVRDAVQKQPQVHAANLSSTPLLAQVSDQKASPSSPPADSAATCSDRSWQSSVPRSLNGYDTSASSQQGSATPLHSRDSASSSYTKAGSTLSKACSSPVQHRLTEGRSQRPSSGVPTHRVGEPAATPAGHASSLTSSQMESSRPLLAAAMHQVHSCTAVQQKHVSLKHHLYLVNLNKKTDLLQQLGDLLLGKPNIQCVLLRMGKTSRLQAAPLCCPVKTQLSSGEEQLCADAPDTSALCVLCALDTEAASPVPICMLHHMIPLRFYLLLKLQSCRMAYQKPEEWLHCRQDDALASLASRESIPDESLIAEGWIVAGTIMSNRDYRPGKLSLQSSMGSSQSFSITVLPGGSSAGDEVVDEHRCTNKTYSKQCTRLSKH